jgi:RNA polymerase sigma factor (sigma-70 family)
MDDKKGKLVVDARWPDEKGSREHSAILRAYLIERYGELRRRLTRRLGSSDWAEDALQDTFLRLDGKEIAGELRNPAAYLLQAAFNVAKNRFRAESRFLDAADVESLLLDVADDAPDALRVIESRSDLMRLKQVMAELPRRQRDILLAARVENLSQPQIATRFGISVSLVEKELKKAQEHCVKTFRQRTR